jgi:hypothetical protein
MHHGHGALAIRKCGIMWQKLRITLSVSMLEKSLELQVRKRLPSFSEEK